MEDYINDKHTREYFYELVLTAPMLEELLHHTLLEAVSNCRATNKQTKQFMRYYQNILKIRPSFKWQYQQRYLVTT
jgi:hypothetical protein